MKSGKCRREARNSRRAATELGVCSARFRQIVPHLNILHRSQLQFLADTYASLDKGCKCPFIVKELGRIIRENSKGAINTPVGLPAGVTMATHLQEGSGSGGVDAAENGRLVGESWSGDAQTGGQHTDGHQVEAIAQRACGRPAAGGVKHGHHAVAAARIIGPAQPRQRQEVRHLPEVERSRQDTCTQKWERYKQKC